MPRVDHEHASLYYEVYGERGPALVFAHGRGGNGASWWQQVPFFRRRYRIVVFDHRCFGRSACPDAHGHVRHFVGDLLAILDDAGIDKAALVCQSMGGRTGLGMAIAHPERVHSLVLACTAGGLNTPKVLASQERRDSLPRGAAFPTAALAPDYPQRQPAMAWLYEQIRAFNAGPGRVMSASMADPANGISPEALAGYAVPTLVLTGERDTLFPPPVLHEVARTIPGATVHDFPNVGHSAYFEDAQAFNAVVDSFLARYVPR